MLARMITALCFYLFYWLCCFLGTGTDKKNLAGLRSYPDTVQQAVRKYPVLGKAAPQEKSIISILLGNLLLFTVVFSILGFALKKSSDWMVFGPPFGSSLRWAKGWGCLIS